MSVRHTCGRCEAELPAEPIVAHAVFCHRCGTMWPAPSRLRAVDMRRLTGRLSLGVAVVLFTAGVLVFGVMRKHRHETIAPTNTQDDLPPSLEAPSPPVRLGGGTLSRLPVRTIAAHDGSIVNIAYLPVGTDLRLATAGEDRRVRVWDADRGTTVGAAWRSPADITAMAASGSVIAVGDNDGNVRVLRAPLVNNSAGLTFRGPGRVSIAALALSDGGRYLAAAAGTSVRLWIADDPDRILCDFQDHTDFVNALAFSPDGRLLASASEDSHVRQVQTGASGVAWNTLVGHKGGVTAVAFVSQSPRTAVTISRDRTLRVWNTDTGNERGRYEVSAGMTTSAVSPDGRLVAAAGNNPYVRVWRRNTEPATGLAVGGPHFVDLGPLPQTVVRCLAFSPDGRMLAAGDSRGRVSLWNVERLSAGEMPTD